MKVRIHAVALLMSLMGAAGIASAKGCLEGAAVGGVAGHFAGRHTVLGGAVGCAIGHHRAKVKDRQAARAAAQAHAQGQEPTNARQPQTVPANAERRRG